MAFSFKHWPAVQERSRPGILFDTSTKGISPKAKSRLHSCLTPNQERSYVYLPIRIFYTSEVKYKSAYGSPLKFFVRLFEMEHH